MSNYYKTLEIDSEMNIEEIGKHLDDIYRKWTIKLNSPDINIRHESERLLAIVLGARDILLNEDKRAEYDEKLSTSNKYIDSEKIVSNIIVDMEANELYADIKDGFGEHTWSNGKKYVGEWKQGIPNGQGKMVYKSGGEYDGHWVDGIYHGFGTLKKDGSVWQGEFNKGKISKGKCDTPSGNNYEGDFVDGIGQGKGVFLWADGRKYIGDFLNGKSHGKGVFYFTNGSTYEGDFVEGIQNGMGIQKGANGDIYEGEQKDGERCGKGKFIRADGLTHVGQFEHNSPNGVGVMTWPDGGKAEGTFKNGYSHGYGKRTLADGQVYEGQFVDGNAHGFGIEILPCGDRYEGNFLAGDYNGHGIMTWANGNKYEGEWLNGHREGKGKHTSLNGPVFEGEFSDSKDLIKGTKTVEGKVYEGTWTKGVYKKNSKCYLTTAMCDILGKEDNCKELETMRAFRDNVLLHTEEGKQLVNEYYHIAPKIVEVLNKHINKNKIATIMFNDHILGILKDIEDKNNNNAISKYKDMVNFVRTETILS